jgi:hypothetical protein
MSDGYRAALALLADILRHLINAPTATDLLAALREADDHGLLDWCFLDSEKIVKPFSTLRKHHPQIWAECVAVLEIPVDS